MNKVNENGEINVTNVSVCGRVIEVGIYKLTSSVQQRWYLLLLSSSTANARRHDVFIDILQCFGAVHTLKVVGGDTHGARTYGRAITLGQGTQRFQTPRNGRGKALLPPLRGDE